MRRIHFGICFGLTAGLMGCSSADAPPSQDAGTNDVVATDASAPDADASAPVQYMALVRGKLAGVSYDDGGDAGAVDLSQAKATHDQIAKSGEAEAKAAGDIAHAVLLGTDLLDSTPNEFLAIDRWTDATAMKSFYANPQIQQRSARSSRRRRRSRSSRAPMAGFRGATCIPATRTTRTTCTSRSER